MYCRNCLERVEQSTTYAGEPSFTCPCCGHEVAAAVRYEATLSASERNARETARLRAERARR